MAQAIPCAVCGEVQEADWLLTNRSDGWSDDMPRTFGCCQLCLIKMSLQMVGLDPDTVLGGSEPEPEGPGVLEQIEQAEGEVQPVAVNGRARKSKATPEAEPQAEVAEETASADVDS